MSAFGEIANRPVGRTPFVAPEARERLYAVKQDGFRHYVRLTGRLGDHGPALCSAMPDNARRKWTWLKQLANGDRVCMTCHAIACSEPTIIIFPI